MYKRIYANYLMLIVVGIILSHAVFSYFLSFTVSHIYRQFMMDIRNLDYSFDERFGMSRAYLGSTIRSAKKPVVLVLGSSFSFAYTLPAKQAYSKWMSDRLPNKFVMNASVVGDSGENLLDQIHYLQKNKIKVDTLIIEINLFNMSKIGNKQLLPQLMLEENPYDKDNWVKRHVGSFAQTYYYFYLHYPHGFNSVVNMDVNRLYTIGQYAEPDYSFVPLPDTYAQNYPEFKKNFPYYRDFLKATLTMASEVSDRVYFFVSPIYLEGLKQTQFKLSDIKKEVKDVYQVCHAMQKINCLQPPGNYAKSNFVNLSHFGHEGHEMLADWLSKELLKAERPK